jgi:sensor histidine kinase YesM
MEEQCANKIDLENYLNLRNILIDYFYTIAIATLIALILTLTSSDKHFLINFVISQSFGIAVCSAVLLSFWIFHPQNWKTLLTISLLAVCAGVLAGLQMGIFILDYFFGIVLNWRMSVMVQAIITALIFSSAAAYFFITKAKLKQRNELIERERIKSIALQKETLEVNLRLLQAQIEPHFLFNTLSNILSLIDTEPARSKAMLLDLTKYLRTSLSRTLPEKTTLSQEMDMIRAYLNIQKVRMDERLNFRIDLPDILREHSFPPMLLQPLVENAVRHGLEPKVEGGEVTVGVARENDCLRIEVADTGLGFSSFGQGGVGITNVQERLRLLFNGKGRLIIEENKPYGVKAIIEVPTDDQSNHC